MVSVDNFLSGFKEIEDYLKSVAGSFMSALDKTTYKMTIEGLKSPDPEAVKVILDQLAQENKKTSIAPVFLVSRSHPVPWVRQQATRALSGMVSPEDLRRLTDGKDVKAAVQALLNEYGHYKN